MAYQQKENSGSLFRNERKERDEQPDRTGSALIGGVEYWVSGWIKEGERGSWLSLAFKPKDAKLAEKPKDRTGGLSKMQSDEPW